MSDAQNRNVLIAEDDPVFRRLLQFTIERCGFNVIAVADGNLAWERLQQRDIDLLITDQQMPHCTGIELLLRIANQTNIEAGSSPIVAACILCTAKGLEMDRERVREQFKLLAVMGKPFSPKQLSRVVVDYFATKNDQDSLSNDHTLGHGSVIGISDSHRVNGTTAATGAVGLPIRKRDVWNVCQTN